MRRSGGLGWTWSQLALYASVSLLLLVTFSTAVLGAPGATASSTAASLGWVVSLFSGLAALVGAAFLLTGGRG
jgi:uncharacterized membrane protein (DUF485 family)